MTLYHSLLGILAAVSLVGCAKPSQTATTQPGVPLLASPRAISEIAASVRNDIFWLADDVRQGRGVGTEGLAQAGEYIAERFRRFGLQPMPGLDGYFQPFPYNVGNVVGPGTRLSVNGVELQRGQFTAFTRSQAGTIDGPLAFVGYGIQSEENKYDDFAGIDVKDHVVMIMRWEPVDENGKSRWAEEDFSREAAINRKVNRAIEAGAKGIILVNAPLNHDDAEPLMDPQAGLRRTVNVPVYHVTTAAANQILAAANAPALETLQNQIDQSQTPASALLPSATISGAVELIRDESSVRNVVAYLPGTGPNANEYVVVGAHYDHIGRGGFGSMAGSGQIHNGADDNASGTTALIQLAENLALAGRQNRSVIFVAFTLEESGLIGSRNFVNKSPVPLNSIVAMLNLDMVGRVTNEHVYVGGSGTADAFASILSEIDVLSPIEIHDMGKGGRGPSDHMNFSTKKIPVLFFFSGMHPDYHAPGDDAEKVNFKGIAQVVDLSFNLVQRLCQMPRQTYVDKYDSNGPDVNVLAGEEPRRQAAPEAREMIEPDRPRLGIVPDYTSAGSSEGVLISGVSDNTTAQAAGLKGGDIITQLNSTRIKTLEDIVEFINQAKVGDKVAIGVLREGKPMILESIMRGRPGSN